MKVGWLVVGCCVLATRVKQKCLAFFFFLIKKFVFIYMPGDGKATHPSMKIVILKLAFEVLVLGSV